MTIICTVVGLHWELFEVHYLRSWNKLSGVLGTSGRVDITIIIVKDRWLHGEVFV